MEAVRIRIGLHKSPVNRHPTAAQQRQLAAQKHELPVGRLQRSRIVLAKIGNRLVARRSALAQPDHLQIAPRLGFEPARTSYPVLIAVQIQLQQQRRIERWLTGAAARFGMLESQRLKIGNYIVDGISRIG